MLTINDAYANALLADAAYVGNLAAAITPALLIDTLSPRMTPTLAAHVGKNYSVVTQIASAGSSFDATVWRANNADGTPNPGGKLYISMRGTQQVADFLTDAQLALTGNAGQQIIDMMNWWLQITAPTSNLSVTQYRYARDAVSEEWSWSTYSVTGLGLVSAADLALGVEVNGHSLGGYLASAFTRLLGTQANVTLTSTFNSAGFAPGSESVFTELQALIGASLGRSAFPGPGDSSQLNYFAMNGLNFTTNSLWFNQVGQRVELFNEEGTGIPNHYMFKQTDVLALGAALEKLDSTMSFARLNDLIQAGSNFMAASIEGVLDALRRMLLDPATGSLPLGDAGDSAPSRLAFHNALKQLQDSEAFTSLISNVTIAPVGSNIATQAIARVDFQTVVALETLSPFVINGASAAGQAALVALWQTPAWSQTYQGWQADQPLTQAQKDAGQQIFSDSYYTDRALLLQTLIARNTQNRDAGQQVYHVGAPIDRATVFEFTDPGNPAAQAILITQRQPGTGLPEQRIAFGSEGDDLIQGSDTNKLGDRLYGGGGNDSINGLSGDDYLEGNAGVDSLSGGAGADKLLGGADADTLDGGEQSDLLLGGLGSDTYMLRASDGASLDTINDAGGQGSIKVIDVGNIEIVLGQGAIQRVADGTNLWQSQDKRFTYSTVLESDASTTLTISGAGVNAKVLNFSNGELGISLPSLAPGKTVIEPTGITVEGDKAPLDFDPNTAGIQSQVDEWGNVIVGEAVEADRIDTIYDSQDNDLIISHGGNDLVYASRGGSDLVQSGSGTDHVELGAGDDMAELGSERDNAMGGAGNDQIYGDIWTPMQTLFDQTQAGADAQADLLAGNSGEDTLVGGASADALWGGDGADLLVGGAGDDNMFGDFEVSVVSNFWSVPRSALSADANGASTFTFSISGVGWSHGADPQADLLLGGAGSDALHGGGGDDYLDGGVGNDFIFGGVGSDAALGEAGDDVVRGDGYPSTSSLAYAAPELHGNDLVDGGDGDDQLFGDGGNDDVRGAAGNDLVEGDAHDTDNAYHGADTLDGGVGNDSMYGGGRDDEMFGGDGEDFLFGDMTNVESPAGLYHGVDWLDGGAGGDQLVGDGGGDTLIGGTGADTLFGDNPNLDPDFHGADHLEGGDDSDQLVGGGGGDTLLGGAGDDNLFGDDDGATGAYEGDDSMDGGAGNDHLQGYGGNDTLQGGTGYDQLLGQAGNDTYVFTVGDTSPGLELAEFVDDAEGVNHVSLDGMDIASMNLVATTDAEVHLLQTGQDSIFIRGLRTGAIGTVQVTGVTYSANEYFGQTYASAISQSTSEAGSDLQGGKLADNLTGTGGNSTLAGGAGPDTLTASGGNNTFAYNLGDGTDTITDNSPLLDASGNPQTSKVVFGQGIEPDTIQLDYVGSALRIGFGADQPGALLINGFNPSNALAPSSVDRFEFADGTALTRAELLARGFDLVGTAAIDVISGTNLADRLAGGAGADLVAGRSGDDIYLFNPGDGADTIADADTLLGGNDTLRFGAGIYADSVEARRSFNQLQLIAGTDIVTIQNYFVGGADVVEHIEFADGTHWTAADIQARLWLGSSGNDSIVGDGSDNQLFGQGGDDQLFGMAGNDFLSGGAGVDTLEGGEGDDRYFFGNGDGSEFIFETSGADILEFGFGITPDDIIAGQSGNDMWLSLIGVPGGVEIRDHFLPGTDEHKIEAILFADGTVWGQADVVELALRATDGNDFIEGFSLDDQIDSKGGDDIVFAAGGNDTITGGTGSDALRGQAGNDIYLFGLSAGDDLVAEDYGGLVSDLDRLVYLDGISYADASFRRMGNDLIISSVVKGFNTRVANQFATNTNANGVELVSFADGVTLDRTMLRQEALRASNGNDTLEGADGGELIDGLAGDDWIYGQGGNDTLRGGPGQDYVFGGQGDDTFIYQLGDQADLLGDGDFSTGNGGGGLEVLRFGAGIAASSVTPSRAAGHLLLTISDIDRVHVLRYFERGDFESIQFADGTVWTQATIGQMLPFNGTEGADSMGGTNSADYMYGLGNGTGTADTIRGFSGDDVIDGGAGEDRIYAGDGNDLIQGGVDTARKIAYRDSLNGEAGNDRLIAGSAPADMVGGRGNDLALGAAGADTFTEDAADGSHNLMYGAAGTDNLRMYGGGAGLAIGGAAGDTINGGSGTGGINSRLIVAFNKSDGIDMVGLLGSGSTISVGGGALYSNLSFQVNGANLRLKTGSSHYVELVGWYSNAPGEGKNVSTLQIVTEGTRDYSASSADPMKNRKIQTFDFLGLANAFDVARAAGQNFNLANNLAAFRIGGSDMEMVGGAIAYQYARTGNLGALNYPQMQAVIDAPEFGTGAQPTVAPSGPAMAEATMASDSSIESSTIELRTASEADAQYETVASPTAGPGAVAADSIQQESGGQDLVAQWFKPTRENDLSFQDDILRGESGVGATGPGDVAAGWKRSHRWLDRDIRNWGVGSDADADGTDLAGLSYLGLDQAGFDMPRAVVGLRGVAGHDFKAFRGLQEGVQSLGTL